MQTKVCSKCKIEKPLNEFHKHKECKDGVKPDCKVCYNAQCRAYRLTNKEKIAEKRKPYMKKWREENKERLLEWQREYSKTNKEQVLEATRRWAAENKDKISVLRHLRRARKLGAEGNSTNIQLKARVQYYGEKCYICGKPYEEIDHVIPLAKGGSDWSANKRPICKSCNLRKNAKWPFDIKKARLEAQEVAA